MSYIGKYAQLQGSYEKADDISSQFNGTATQFYIKVGGNNKIIQKDTNLIVSINGTYQHPGDDYTVSFDTIIFNTAPASGSNCSITILGDVFNVPANSNSTLEGLTNVTITSPVNDQVLKYQNGTWVNGDPGTTFISNNTDVDTSSAVAGDRFVFDGTTWGPEANTLVNLDDVNVPSPTLDQVLTYNNGEWVAKDIPLSNISSISDLSDVDTVSSLPATNDVLSWDGSNWIPRTLTEVESINDLNDVDTILTPPTDGDSLVWDGTNNKWYPKEISFEPTFDINDLNDVDTTTNPPDVNDVLEWDGNNWVPSQVTQSAQSFTGLTDTPNDYTGQSGKVVKVNATGDGLEFGDTVTSNHASTHESGGTDVITHNNLSGITSINAHPISAITGLQTELDGKEPVFSKNTAFNKNFGSVAGTVCEGHIGDAGYQHSLSPHAPSNAEPNNISDTDAIDLTDNGNTTLHYHLSDRDRANHTGTQTASTISDFHTEVSANIDVAANTAARHDEIHTISSHADTSATGTQLDTLTNGSNADSLHSHTSKLEISSDGTSVDLAVTKINFTGSGVTISEPIDHEIDVVITDTGGGATSFTELTDTPADYTGNEGKLIKVNATGDGLIFGDPSGSSVSWGDILGTLSNQTDLQNELDAKLSISDIDDTPIDGKTSAPISSNWAYDHTNAVNPHNITASDVGLGNVNNTSDLDKPISTATQSALDNKEDSLGNPVNDGMVLVSAADGTRSWEDMPGQWLEEGSDFTATPGYGYLIQSTSSITCTLPLNPEIGSEVGIVNANGNASSYNITIDPNGEKIFGITQNYIISEDYKGIVFTYTGIDKGWIITSISIRENTAFNKDFGTTANTVCEGNDPRLSDARIPLSHASSHELGGSDEINHDDINGSGTYSHAQIDEYINNSPSIYRQNFINADLSSGILTITHNLNNEFNIVQVYDNNKKIITPDDITAIDMNNIEIDLSSYGTIIDTWNCVILG